MNYFSKVTDLSTNRIGDTVYVHRAGTVVYQPDGSTLETEFMDKLTFRDGKIIEYLQFVDTFAIAKLLGL
jgi:ketosteroid isomerase-like protein